MGRGLGRWFASIAVTLAPDATVAKVLGHAWVSTTTDPSAHLRATAANRVAPGVSVAVNGTPANQEPVAAQGVPRARRDSNPQPTG